MKVQGNKAESLDYALCQVMGCSGELPRMAAVSRVRKHAIIYRNLSSCRANDKRQRKQCKKFVKEQLREEKVVGVIGILGWLWMMYQLATIIKFVWDWMDESKENQMLATSATWNSDVIDI